MYYFIINYTLGDRKSPPRQLIPQNLLNYFLFATMANIRFYNFPGFESWSESPSASNG